MAIRTISNTGGNWNATTTWVGGVVPAATDDIVATTTSGNLTINVTANCRTFDFTNYHGVLSMPAVFTATLPAGVSGACKFSPTMTVTSSGTGSMVLRVLAGQTLTLYACGLSDLFASISINNSSTYTGTVKLGDDLMMPNRTMSLVCGTFDTGGYALTARTLATTATYDKTMYLRSSIITIANVPSSTINLSYLPFTLNAGTSTIIVKATTNAAKNLSLGGLTYHDLVLEGGGTDLTTISGANTFNNLTIAGPRSVTFTAGTVQTIQGALTCSGASGSMIALNSSTAGTPATLSKADGNVAADYLTLQDIAAGGGARWYAGRHSQNISGNSGWIFDDPFLPAAVVTAPLITGAPFGGQLV